MFSLATYHSFVIWAKQEVLFYKLYIPEENFMNSEFRTGILFFVFGFISVLIIDFLAKTNKNEK